MPELESDPAGVHVTRPRRSAWSRWLSRRALLLHLEVAIVAPGCAVAGWWQATRALAGNGLSWVYSVEWPVFSLLAIAGWWHLLHEDPDAYRERKTGRRDLVGAAAEATGSPAPAPAQDGAAAAVSAAAASVAASVAVPTDEEPAAAAALPPAGAVAVAPGRSVTVDRTTARYATFLAALAGLDLLLGMATLVVVSPERPSGWLPTRWVALYVAHGVVGLPLSVGAVLLLVRVRSATRIARLSGWTGAVGVLVAATGGLLTVSHPARLAGMALMLLGAVAAGFGYLFPTFEKLGS